MDITTDDIAVVADIFTKHELTRLVWGDLLMEKRDTASTEEPKVTGFNPGTPAPREDKVPKVGDQRSDYLKLFGGTIPKFDPASAPTRGNS